MKTSLLAIASALLALSAVPALRAQEEAGEPMLPEIFFEQTDVNVVNVEVYVTDKKGRRVSGLGKEDFEVYEDGERMAITNFYAVADGRPVAPTPAVAALPEAEQRLRLSEIAPVPEEQRLHLIIYVDNFHIRPANRNRVLHRTRRFLHEKIGAEDRVMVVSYDRSLHVRQPFTSDMGLVADALAELEELSGIAVMRDAERRKMLEEIDDSRDAFEALQHARSFAEAAYTETHFGLEALANHVGALSGLVGRKAILYVSDGLPMIVGEDLFHYVDERFRSSQAKLEAFNYDYSNRYREIVAKANAGGVTFYTLEAGGLQAHASISAEYGGTRSGGGMAFIDSIRSGNLQAPLYLLAEDTGGEAIVNTNAVEAGLARVAADFDNYYSLGYQPGHHADGRYYKIEVKVKRKGLVVRHRRGYRDRTTEARLTDGSIASLFFGFESNPLDVDLVFGDALPRDGGHFHLPLTVRIPLGEIALAPQESGYVGRVKLSVVVMDGEGRVSPVLQQDPVTITIPESDIGRARKQHFAYDVTLLVRKGGVGVAVAIRDELGAETSFVRDTVYVAAG